MKTLKIVTLFALAFIAFKASAQTDKATTIRIVEDKNYVFVATTAIPTNITDINNILRKMPGNAGGGSISLSGSSYDVRVTNDSVVVYLPYYGRAYSASPNSDENGYKFTTKKFTYDVKKTKKGGWDVNVNTKDVKDNVRMILNITSAGYATLNVMSNNKQSIIYNGYLSENKKKE
ncbi:DUF4251 domain-containing protein [Pedobacter sp. LMG 31464]|uniref:DUF4251 domain-containing protein n=1 Tax=Pedobacter planticolens TaxID=2679964 RepID=A0A923DYX1_9SPHI|nr:DUF4251 domain-containing protein [Pedobacter planticolens]MBB2146627.1 DUF4251 domain-containing protein [Pedobacter planticolens]